MLTTEQIVNRKIGGSDIATILGVNPWKTAEELRLEILGRLDRYQEGNDATEAGEIMEEGIRQLYAKRTGRTVHRSHQTLVHPEHDFLTVHIDGRVVGERRGLECKNVHWRMAQYWGEPGSDQIAEYYLPQVMADMLVMDYPCWDVAAYFGGPDLRIYTVERDSEWDDIIIEATKYFWETNVLQDVSCGIDLTRPDALRTIKRLYPGTDGSTRQADHELMHWHAVLRQAKTLKSSYEQTAIAAAAHLQLAMGNAAILELPDGSRYERKTITRKAYAVEATSYTDFRYKAPKDEK